LGGRPIVVYGTVLRRISYIDDIARGTVGARNRASCHHLGNNDPVELRRMIALIEENLGQKARIEFQPRQPADVIATWADIRRASEVLHWKPETPIEIGLQKTVRWFLAHRELAESLKS
jgi:nucleoside-diphosphate-sugar epimerase